MMYSLGACLPIAMLILGVILIAMGLDNPQHGGYLVGGSILLAAVLIAQSGSDGRTPGNPAK